MCSQRNERYRSYVRIDQSESVAGAYDTNAKVVKLVRAYVKGLSPDRKKNKRHRHITSWHGALKLENEIYYY